VQAQPVTPDTLGNPLPTLIDIAQESCRIVAQPGFYPQGDPDEAYAIRMTPVLLQRLAIAGRRLAAMLNQALP
jgi:hypothetical protein